MENNKNTPFNSKNTIFDIESDDIENDVSLKKNRRKRRKNRSVKTSKSIETKETIKATAFYDSTDKISSKNHMNGKEGTKKAALSSYDYNNYFNNKKASEDENGNYTFSDKITNSKVKTQKNKKKRNNNFFAAETAPDLEPVGKNEESAFSVKETSIHAITTDNYSKTNKTVNTKISSRQKRNKLISEQDRKRSKFEITDNINDIYTSSDDKTDKFISESEKISSPLTKSVEKSSIFTDGNIPSENSNKSRNHKLQKNKFIENEKISESKFESGKNATDVYTEVGISTNGIELNKNGRETEISGIAATAERESVFTEENIPSENSNKNQIYKSQKNKFIENKKISESKFESSKNATDVYTEVGIATNSIELSKNDGKTELSGMAAVTEKGNIFTDKNILSENRNKSNNHKPQRNKFTEDIKTKNKFESNSEKTNLYSEAGIITDVITFNESESKTAKISSVIEEKSVLKTENEDTNISLNANNKKSEKLKKLSSREKRKLINESNKAKAKYFHNKTNSQKDVELKLSDNLSQSFKEKSSSSSNQRAYVKDSTEDTSQKEKNYSTKRIDIKENLLSKSNTLLTGVHSASKLANKIDDDNDTDNASNEMISDAVNISEKIFRRYINNFFNNKKSLLKNKVFTDKSDLAQKLNNDSFDEQEKSKKINYMQKARKQQARVAYQTAKNAAQKATNTGVFAKLSEKLAVLLISNPQSGSIILIIILIIGILIALCSSCSIMSMSVGNGVISTTYMTDEKEIYDASVYYTKLEADLRADINKKVQRDKNSFLYDDVRYNIDSFNHDPEVLISFLSAKYPGWSFDLNLKIWFSDIMAGLDYETVKDVEKDIFNAQYELEERTFYEWHYPSANAMFPVLWYVKEYTLVNNGLENIVAELMNEDVQEYYDLLLQYRGNRVWFNSPVNYNWKDTVANLCGYTVDGATSFSTYSNTSNLTYKDDGSTVSTGTTIVLPDGMGKYFTYMGWQTITSPSSLQYQLREQAGMNFDAEGFGIINNRYVVAVTNTYGSVGDYIDVYQSDGTVFPCIIGDIKNQNDAGCNKWGHQQGKVVIEFVVDKSTWYPSHANPGTNACHPEWGGKTITKIVNVGSYSQGEAAPSAGQDGGIVSSSELIDNLSTDVTPHKGIDIAGTYNTNVYAVFDGTVAKVTSHAVSMQSADKEYQVIFDSITNIAVTEGQEISAGDLIGTMTDTESLRNNSGIFVSEKSIGIPHLHIELRNIPDNQQYNPYFYFDVGAEEAPTIIVGNNGTGQLVPGNSETGNLVAQYALSRLGYIYLWGGGHSEAEVRDPNSTRFDCSGLVCWAYCQAGSYIGVHNTKELATMGTPVDYNDMQAGDIILWSSNGSHSGVHHVAIYIGNGMIVEAPYDGQPITTNPVYDKNLIYTIRRLYSN